MHRRASTPPRLWACGRDCFCSEKNQTLQFRALYGKVAACEGETDVEPIGEVWDELKSYKERISEFKQVESLSTGGIDYKLYTLDE